MVELANLLLNIADNVSPTLKIIIVCAVTYGFFGLGIWKANKEIEQ
jgi:hypothetical protein